MKRIMFCASMLMLCLGNVFAEDENEEIFPLSGITVGMSSKELMTKYPFKDTLFSKKDDDNTLLGGIIFYEISTNRFWDVLAILIEDSKVNFLSYFYANNELTLQNPNIENHDKIVGNIKPLFKQLKKQLGAEFEKKVTYGEVNSKSRCAMYVWKREKDVVAFTHSPVAQYKKGSRFDCQLVVASKLENLGGLYERMATNSVPEDAKLWADAMDD